MFLKLSDDLARIRPGARDVILCPLCLAMFDKSALYGDEPLVTEEHIVPGSVGGRFVTLTCRRCNNEQGSSIDSHVVRMVRNLDAIEGDGSNIPGTIRFSGMQFSVKVSWTKQDNGDVVTNFSIPGGKPEDIEELRSMMMRSNCREFEFDLNFRYRLDRMRLGLLRISYLAMFSYAGYSYILGPGPNRIRTALIGTDPAPNSFLSGHIELAEVTPNPPGNLAIVPVCSGGAVIGYCIIVCLFVNRPRYFAVVMPPADFDSSLVFDHLERIMQAFDGLRFSTGAFPFGNYSW